MKFKNKPIVLIILLIIILAISGGIEANSKDQVKTPRVTMMLFETDLREALNEMSLQTGVNIITDQTVNGLVTVDLQDVPLEEALYKVLVGGGYTFRKIDDFYLVGLPNPDSNTFGDLSELEVVELNHVTSKEVLGLLPSFLKPYVKGVHNSNLLTINAPPKELERIRNFIKKLDRPKKQVEIKVIVTEIDSQKVKELGNSLLTYNDVTGENSNKKISYEGTDDLLILNYQQLMTKLKVLEAKQKAKVEADPQLLLADGKTAELFVGEEQTLLLDSADGSSTSKELKVGMKLEMTANIVGEEEVLLDINPEISHFVNTDRNNIVVKENSISTTLRLKSGQTTSLAAVTMKGNSSYDKKIPILGDIPLVRWFFRSKKEQQKDRKLMIFVTPIIK